MSETNVDQSILALERAVLNRWCKGDPNGFTDNAVNDVTYFDHLSKMRVDGLRALKEHLSHFEGAVDAPRYEMPCQGRSWGWRPPGVQEGALC